MASWHVYLVRCQDGSLYCGIASDLARRIAQHNSGSGAKYIVPSRRPVVCVWKRRARDAGDALRLEYWVKRRDVATKRMLASGSAGLRRTGDGWCVATKATKATMATKAAASPARNPKRAATRNPARPSPKQAVKK